MTATLAEVALVLFVGMGPVKVLVYYLTAIREADARFARVVAFRAVGTAILTAFGLLLAGALLMRLLHFTGEALIVACGLVLLGYGVRLVLRETADDALAEPPSDAALLRLAVYPMGVPLILNPAGIAAATIFSAEASDLVDLALLAAVVVVIGAIDLVVLWLARPLGPRLPREATLVLEQLLGVLLAAVAVELIVVGLVQFGILDIPLRR